jgi:toxin secretion/phage lysis holin
MPENRQTERSNTMTLQEFFTALKEAATPLFPQSQPEQAAMGMGAAAGAILSLLFGGFDQALYALCALVILDFITGIAAAGKEGGLQSDIGRRGIGHKAAIFGVVAFCNLLDKGMGAHILRNIAICAYSANEGLSILENIDRMGYGQYIPSFLATKIAEIREARTGGKNSNAN